MRNYFNVKRLWPMLIPGVNFGIKLAAKAGVPSCQQLKADYDRSVTHALIDVNFWLDGVVNTPKTAAPAENQIATEHGTFSPDSLPESARVLFERYRNNPALFINDVPALVREGANAAQILTIAEAVGVTIEQLPDGAEAAN